MLNFRTLYWPQGFKKEKKRIPSNLGSQFATLGGQKTSQKMLEVGPKFVQPWLLVYKAGRVGGRGGCPYSLVIAMELSKQASIWPQNVCKKRFSLEATKHMGREEASCSFLSSLVRWSSELKAGCGMTCDGDLSTKYTIRLIWDWRKRHSLISSLGVGYFRPNHTLSSRDCHPNNLIPNGTKLQKMWNWSILVGPGLSYLIPLSWQSCLFS
jgi:hypothetical protein